MTVAKFCSEIYRTYIVEMPNNFAAALSYYYLLSLVPTLYIALLLARMFIDDSAVMQVLFAQVTGVMGVEVADLLKDALAVIAKDGTQRSTVDLVISSFALLLSASLVFFKLQYALNTIWKVPPAAKDQTNVGAAFEAAGTMAVLLIGIDVLAQCFIIRRRVYQGLRRVLRQWHPPLQCVCHVKPRLTGSCHRAIEWVMQRRRAAAG